MTNIDLCSEILENIKHSLNHCCNNKKIHSFTFSNYENDITLDKIVLSKCSNIIHFQKQQLVATKTNIIYNIPIIDVYKKYSIEYDVANRQIIIDQ